MVSIYRLGKHEMKTQLSTHNISSDSFDITAQSY